MGSLKYLVIGSGLLLSACAGAQAPPVEQPVVEGLFAPAAGFGLEDDSLAPAEGFGLEGEIAGSGLEVVSEQVKTAGLSGCATTTAGVASAITMSLLKAGVDPSVQEYLTSQEFLARIPGEISDKAGEMGTDYLLVLDMDSQCRFSPALYENTSESFITELSSRPVEEGHYRVVMHYEERVSTEAWAPDASDAAFADAHGTLKLVLSHHPQGSAVALYMPGWPVLQAGVWDVDDVVAVDETADGATEPPITFVEGLYESGSKVVHGDLQTVTLGGVEVTLPARWYEENDKWWMRYASQGRCIAVPVDGRDGVLYATAPVKVVDCGK